MFLQGRYRMILLALVLCTLGALSCKHEIPDLNTGGPDPGPGPGPGPGNPPVNTCSSDTVYFTQQILPLLVSNCALSGCHDAASHQDGVILTSYTSIMNTAEVRPGRPNDSELYEVITEDDDDDRMPRPPQNPLTAEQISLIRKWILQGAKNNSCESSCQTTNITFTASIKPLIATKCQGCHSGGSPQGGINLSTYAGVKAKVDDGRLWGAVNHLPGFSAMPKNGAKLSQCELDQIRIWITAGAPNN